ncbi:hypothetical protein PAXRUDRAFT_821358 [Paxillus rubicundulus Ve08.2h10]|uniref:Unplaced genomic scaffold scaffold_5, whole genome shotgun sequence n=1 Tax=Paxillus rubicundulus Ve08.2h10 TaxID=930991 RepID=A0A0D0E6Q2_9AGAM|nr:hypothetical protein PAXRUDRAFT_821358 [Paxillus rubicundulus Ve08.2h10]
MPVCEPLRRCKDASQACAEQAYELEAERTFEPCVGNLGTPHAHALLLVLPMAPTPSKTNLLSLPPPSLLVLPPSHH